MGYGCRLRVVATVESPVAHIAASLASMQETFTNRAFVVTGGSALPMVKLVTEPATIEGGRPTFALTFFLDFESTFSTALGLVTIAFLCRLMWWLVIAWVAACQRDVCHRRC